MLGHEQTSAETANAKQESDSVLRSGEVVAEGTGTELRDRDDLFDTFIGGGAS